jgi:hypothetical protein
MVVSSCLLVWVLGSGAIRTNRPDLKIIDESANDVNQREAECLRTNPDSLGLMQAGN